MLDTLLECCPDRGQISRGPHELAKCLQFVLCKNEVKEKKLCVSFDNVNTKFSSNNALNLCKVLKRTLLNPQYS